MQSNTVLTVDAIYDAGVLRPVEALPFRPNERVTVRIDVPTVPREWPDDTDEIYREIAAEESSLANAMFGEVQRNWPQV
jgi:predicted DNA-binding antitoxin AbrB/MazE fold protein